ncbi:MAG: hypothetical protein QOG71_3888 [Pyrinomonadaceae bacterium]|nr:hypothetical protein [Pyrinomonadaceae bacterium]
MTKTSKPAPPTAEMGMLGLPGTQQHLLMRAYFGDPNDPRNTGDLGGVPGKYKVVFTLSRPGFPLLSERHFAASSNLQGDSHLAIAKPALKFLDGEEFDQLRFECATVNGKFVFKGLPNDKGFLGKVESEPFDASDFSNAALQAHHAIAPAFSNMSVYLDVPVHIFQMDVIEMRTGSTRISIKTPFKYVLGGMVPIQAPEEQQKYVGLYREALNSNSSNYQFLCLYKIIEGIRERRQRLRGQAALDARTRGEQPPSYSDERVPQDRAEQVEWLNSLFTLPQEWDDMGLGSIFINDVVGKRIGNLIHKGERLHKLRNKVAHAVLDSGEPVISIDNGLDIDEVEMWLPITKCLARYLLKDAFPDMFKSG